jgi:adenylate kinase family enzyme
MGRAGSGKSTVARRLGEALGLPIVHLDRLFWTAGWESIGWTTFGELERAEAGATDWIIDGNYMSSPGFSTRIGRAHLVVVVEAPLIVCLWRVFRRSIAGRADRGDLPAGANDRVSIGFLVWILRWGSRHPRFDEELGRLTGSPVVVVRSSADVESLLKRIVSAAPAAPAD